MNNHIVIIGGGQAAAYAASTIRRYDKKSDLTIFTEENNLPYERPPLSKDFLLEKMNENQCLFFDENFYRLENIKILKNEKIISVDFNNFTMKSKTKKIIFNKLLIATGSQNKKIKIDKLEDKDIFYLRDINESIIIKEKFNNLKNILIIGGGFIGLEIASSASQLGKKVTVIEQETSLMGRVVPKEIADIIKKVHTKNGVEIHLNTNIKSAFKDNEMYNITLRNGTNLKSDMIIAGIGAVANTKLFEGTSLKIDNGILTDEYGQTSIKNVYAAGDVANFFHPLYKSHIRLESWKHAQNHGVTVGKNIVGHKTIYNEIPWMWSDQYNLNLQLTGKCDDYDSLAKRGMNEENGVVYFFLKNRKIIGACGVGIGGKIGRDVRLAGKLAEKKTIIRKEILSDSTQKLNKI